MELSQLLHNSFRLIDELPECRFGQAGNGFPVGFAVLDQPVAVIGTAVSLGTLARTSAMPGSALMRLIQWSRRDGVILPLVMASLTDASIFWRAAAALIWRPSAASARSAVRASLSMTSRPARLAAGGNGGELGRVELGDLGGQVDRGVGDAHHR